MRISGVRVEVLVRAKISFKIVLVERKERQSRSPFHDYGDPLQYLKFLSHKKPGIN